LELSNVHIHLHAPRSQEFHGLARGCGSRQGLV
jgi:hypothetical protein